MSDFSPQDLTEEQEEVWTGWAEQYKSDWGQALDYLVINTSLSDREEAMAYLQMMFARANNVRLQAIVEMMQGLIQAGMAGQEDGEDDE